MTAAKKNNLHLGEEPIGRLIWETTLPAFVSVLAVSFSLFLFVLLL